MAEVAEQADEEIVAEAEPAPKGAPGRLLGAFGFLFALGALAAVGYLYFLLVYLEPNAHLTRSLAQAAGERAALRADSQQLQEAAWPCREGMGGAGR